MQRQTGKSLDNNNLQDTEPAEISISPSPWDKFSAKYPLSLLEAVLWIAALYGVMTGAHWLTENGHFTPPDWLPGRSLQDVIMIGGSIILLAYWKLIRKAELRSLGLRLDRLGGDLKFALVAGAAMGLFYLLLAGGYWVVLQIFFEQPAETFKDHLRGAVFKESGLLFYLAVVVSVPIIEEIWFRGLLYTPMRREIGRWPAIVFLSLIFAAAHGVDWPVNQFLGGLIFAWAYEKRRSLVAPILLHMAGNGSLGVLGWALERWQLV
jgi:membrane protease YdiL (CAAX protease family)